MLSQHSAQETLSHKSSVKHYQFSADNLMRLRYVRKKSVKFMEFAGVGLSGSDSISMVVFADFWVNWHEKSAKTQKEKLLVIAHKHPLNLNKKSRFYDCFPHSFQVQRSLLSLSHSRRITRIGSFQWKYHLVGLIHLSPIDCVSAIREMKSTQCNNSMQSVFAHTTLCCNVDEPLVYD